MNPTEKQQNQKNQAEEKCAKRKTQFNIQKEKSMWAKKMRFKQHFEHSYVKTFFSIFKQQFMSRNTHVTLILVLSTFQKFEQNGLERHENRVVVVATY